MSEEKNQPAVLSSNNLSYVESFIQHYVYMSLQVELILGTMHPNCDVVVLHVDKWINSEKKPELAITFSFKPYKENSLAMMDFVSIPFDLFIARNSYQIGEIFKQRADDL